MQGVGDPRMQIEPGFLLIRVRNHCARLSPFTPLGKGHLVVCPRQEAGPETTVE